MVTTSGLLLVAVSTLAIVVVVRRSGDEPGSHASDPTAQSSRTPSSFDAGAPQAAGPPPRPPATPSPPAPPPRAVPTSPPPLPVSTEPTPPDQLPIWARPAKVLITPYPDGGAYNPPLPPINIPPEMLP